MRSNVRAAPDGARRPCSHSCSVRTETPSSCANCDWDKPVLSRTTATGGIVMIRPCSPLLISRIPSKISNPMLRFALAINFVLNLPKYLCRNILHHIFRVHREHPNVALAGPRVVDNSESTALAMTNSAPSASFVLHLNPE